MEEKKKVLFIGAGLYNYDTTLINELCKNYIVSYVYMFPFKKQHSLQWSILSHFNKTEIIRDLNSGLVLAKLKKLENQDFDYVLIIKGSKLCQIHFDYFRSHFPRARIILYLWDAWSLIENKQTLINNVDVIYTFDSEDSRKYGFKLRPLFYVTKNRTEVVNRYDASFIGTDHSDRLEKLRFIKDICQKNNLNYYFRLKTTKTPIVKSRLGIAPYHKEDLALLVNKPLKYNAVLQITQQSGCVIDFSHPAQCGLTMRTLETLALGRKLITTNKYIRDYKDLNPSWYFVLDDNTNANGLLDFIKRPIFDIEIPDRYSIAEFIKEVLS